MIVEGESRNEGGGVLRSTNLRSDVVRCEYDSERGRRSGRRVYSHQRPPKAGDAI